ncbi:MAG: hypothetical protein M3R38_14495, partial [Actinomycetota bacterium]|nr:hypothetical protein [Actinomycetota bacterium]
RREASRLLREAASLLEGSDLRGASEKLEEARSRILSLREPGTQGELDLASKRESRRSDGGGREAEG